MVIAFSTISPSTNISKRNHILRCCSAAEIYSLIQGMSKRCRLKLKRECGRVISLFSASQLASILMYSQRTKCVQNVATTSAKMKL